jgi:PEP-CTERM motif
VLVKKILSGFGAILLAATVLAQPARALDYCSSVGSLQVCAGFVVSGPYQEGGVGPWLFDLYVTNLAPAQGVSHKIFSAGFAYDGSTAGWALVGAKMNNVTNVYGGGGWNLKNTPNNDVGQLLEVYAEGGGSAAIMPGNFIKLTFSTGSVGINQSNFQLYGWHSGEVNGTSCSLWLATDGTVVGADNADCSSSVVPEPISMVLLGTGLAGIGALRRRRKGLDVENA